MVRLHLTRQAQKFVFTGVLVTGIHVIVAVLFIHLVSATQSLANGIAFIVATLFSYFINTLWSFSSVPHRKNLLRFVSVSLLGCGIAVAISGFADFFALNYWLGIGCVLCIVPPVTFFLHKIWTFK